MTASATFGMPTLIVVTGRPASGKTTLAHALARAVRCPLISRDEVKEGLINTVRKNEAAETDLNTYVYGVYFDVLERLLRNHITLVTEAAFQHKIWQPQLTALQQIARIKLICCDVDAALAKTRFIERSAGDAERSQFHEDLSAQLQIDIAQTLLGEYEAPQLEMPTLIVDTSDGYKPDIDVILAFIQA